MSLSNDLAMKIMQDMDLPSHVYNDVKKVEIVLEVGQPAKVVIHKDIYMDEGQALHTELIKYNLVYDDTSIGQS